MLRYPETATTEDYERALDQEWEMEMQRMNGTTGDKEYIYNDWKNNGIAARLKNSGWRNELLCRSFRL